MLNEQLKKWTDETIELSKFDKAPLWFQQLRAQKLNYLLENGLPNRKEEAWKYLDLSALSKLLPQLKQPQVPRFDSQYLQSLLVKECYSLILIDGHYHKELSQIPATVTVLSLEDMLRSDNTLVVSSFKRELPDAWQKINALNSASLNGGIFVHIGKSAQLDKPIHLINLRTAENVLLSSKNIIYLDTGVNATVFYQQISSANQNYLVLENSNIILKENSQLNYYHSQQESKQATCFNQMLVDLHQDANFNAFDLTLGTKLSRTDIWVNALQTNAECQLNGLYLLNQEQVADHHLTVDHQVAHGQSTQHYRGILRDDAHAIFNSKVLVRPGAQKINSHQLNKNLLLSANAQVNTKPELEIYADDVLCAHGATVGQLSADELFYLKSRGIDEIMASRILVSGFCNELLESIKNKNIAEYIKNLAYTKINQELICQ